MRGTRETFEIMYSVKPCHASAWLARVEGNANAARGAVARTLLCLNTLQHARGARGVGGGEVGDVSTRSACRCLKLILAHLSCTAGWLVSWPQGLRAVCEWRSEQCPPFGPFAHRRRRNWQHLFGCALQLAFSRSPQSPCVGSECQCERIRRCRGRVMGEAPGSFNPSLQKCTLGRPSASLNGILSSSCDEASC